MEHDCKFEDKVMEMYADIKSIMGELRSMNGTVLRNRAMIMEHTHDSVPYRKKVDDIWAVMHTVKWLLGLPFAGFVIWRIFG